MIYFARRTQKKELWSWSIKDIFVQTHINITDSDKIILFEVIVFKKFEISLSKRRMQKGETWHFCEQK